MTGARRSEAERAAYVRLLRAVAAERVAATSLRYVAAEIGMSAPGLALFLRGTSPQRATLEKIHKWHRNGAGANGISLEAARAALEMLASGLEGDDRVTMIRLTLTIIAYLHRKQGSPGPPWLGPLCREYGVGEAA